MNMIYLLSDPRTGDPKYVGVTKNLRRRLSQHKKEFGLTHKCNWLRYLYDDGLDPIVKILEEVSDEDRDIAERFWIAFFRERTDKLVNATDGGDGVPNPSYESIKKMRKAKLGEKNPQSKLSDRQRREINNMYIDGYSAMYISKIFKISNRNVYRVLGRS